VVAVLAHDIEWRMAEPSATGSPTYLTGEYRGHLIETRLVMTRSSVLVKVWEWSIYEPNSGAHDLALARDEVAHWHQAVRSAKDYIDGLVTS
jgi:hypothetical protein